MIGSMIHASAFGTSRVREIARHSTNVVSSLSSNRQYEDSRHKNPCPVSGGRIRSVDLPASSTSEMRVVREWQTQRFELIEEYRTSWYVSSIAVMIFFFRSRR
jgi:hypothetical protein